MAIFDESKVINSLHTDKVVIGKKYYFADTLLNLKQVVEGCAEDRLGVCSKVIEHYAYPFIKDGRTGWEYLYPYEEPPKQIEDLQINEYSNLWEQRKIIHRNLIEAFSEQLGILDKEDDELFSLKAIKAVISNILEIEE